MDNKITDQSLEARLASIHEAQTKSGTVDAEEVQQFIIQAKSLPNWYFLSCRGFNIPFIHEGKAYVFTDERFAERARLHYVRRAFPVEVQKHPIYNGSVFEMLARYGTTTVSINKGASGLSMKTEMFAVPEDMDGAALNRLIAEMTMKMLQGDERGYKEATDGFSRAFCAASILYYPSPNDSDMPKMEKGYYPSLAAWQQQLGKGVWFPNSPQRITTGDGILLSKNMEDARFCNVLRYLAGEVNNCIEDGYIEREIGEMCPGNGRAYIATMNLELIENALTIEEAIAAQKEDFDILLNQILYYAEFGQCFYGDYDGALIPILEEAIEIIDDVGFQRSPFKRLEGVNELLCLSMERAIIPIWILMWSSSRIIAIRRAKGSLTREYS